MHPEDQELMAFSLSVSRQGETAGAITGHIAVCDQCRQRVEWLRAWQKAAELSADVGLPADARSVARRILTVALRARRTIILTPLTVESSGEPIRLAADGEKQPLPHTALEHRATLYSEDPELVLRLMFDPGTQEESLHLIGADPETTANVLIHLVEPSMDFLTDAAGIAKVGGGMIVDPESREWQIRLPDATFMLSPLETGRDAESGEQIVETERGDRIGVTITPGREGISLRIRIAQVAGQAVPERVRLIVTQDPGSGRLVESAVSQPVLITGLNPERSIRIRIFAD